MSVLYVKQPGAKLAITGQRIHVKYKEDILATALVRDLERVILLGPCEISAPAARTLLVERIPVAYCSSFGTYYGCLHPGWENVARLTAQIDCCRDQAFRLETARNIVRGKLLQQRIFLQRQRRNHDEPKVQRAVAELECLKPTISQQTNLDALMGCEGRAAVIYFAGFGACIRAQGLSFPGRRRRPATDPVNSLLSLGYMLTLAEVTTAIQAAGLHPGFGLLHSSSDRRPSLALDVMETFRQAVTDRLVLRLINQRVFDADDFEDTGEDGVRLLDKPQRTFLAEFENSMNTAVSLRKGVETSKNSLRENIRKATMALVHCMEQRVPWSPPVFEL